MLSSIYASKLYRASTRKDKIRAAFDNPINSELVGQLAKALDEEYQRPEFLVKDREPKEPEVTPEVEDAAEPSSDSGPSLGGGAPHRSSPPSPPKGPEESSEEGEAEPLNDSSSAADQGDAGSAPAPDAGEAAPAPVAESTKLNGSTIVGSQIRTEFADMRQVAEQIKGMLNFKDSTSGVGRILIKESELWIYYNDDINLNNVMSDAIELLNASGYTYLEFNRLARSDNAMVFQIDFTSSNRQIKPMAEIDEKKK